MFISNGLNFPLKDLSNANINILKEEELFVSSDRELVTDCNAIHSIIYFCI